MLKTIRISKLDGKHRFFRLITLSSPQEDYNSLARIIILIKI